jgi:hypothetical protein
MADLWLLVRCLRLSFSGAIKRKSKRMALHRAASNSQRHLEGGLEKELDRHHYKAHYRG